MPTKRRIWYGLVVPFVLFVHISQDNELDRIRVIYKSTNERINKGRSTVKYLYKERGLQWRQFSVKEYNPYSGEVDDEWRKLDSLWEHQDYEGHDERAMIFLQANKPIKVIDFVQSLSGDWELMQEYYFYENGTTAFIFERLITFQAYDEKRDLPPGPYILEKRLYFDSNGIRIKTLRSAFVSSNKEKLEPSTVNDIEVPRYRNFKLFPFFSLF